MKYALIILLATIIIDSIACKAKTPQLIALGQNYGKRSPSIRLVLNILVLFRSEPAGGRKYLEGEI